MTDVRARSIRIQYEETNIHVRVDVRGRCTHPELWKLDDVAHVYFSRTTHLLGLLKKFKILLVTVTTKNLQQKP